eukprot:COSAG06_NODE_439_length_15765_cov_69.583812_8_plen_116_part_00
MIVLSEKQKQKVKKAGVDFDAVSKCYTMVAKIKDDYDHKTRDSDKTKMEGFVWSEEGMKIHKINVPPPNIRYYYNARRRLERCRRHGAASSAAGNSTGWLARASQLRCSHGRRCA